MVNMGHKRYRAATLAKRKTLSVSQESDLKIDSTHRYWLSRCGIEDGTPFPHTVYVEALQGSQWVLVDVYDGGPLDDD